MEAFCSNIRSFVLTFDTRYLNKLDQVGHSDKNMNFEQYIAQKFELDALPYLSRQALQEALATKVSFMLQRQPEELFSKLYRLDIFEEKIKAVMDAGGDIAFKLAGLIIDRQIEKEISKKENPSSEPEDEDLAW